MLKIGEDTGSSSSDFPERGLLLSSRRVASRRAVTQAWPKERFVKRPPGVTQVWRQSFVKGPPGLVAGKLRERFFLVAPRQISGKFGGKEPLAL